jgi:ABC-type glycerol-3-phosphate transport system substrate-binding protein
MTRAQVLLAGASALAAGALAACGAPGMGGTSDQQPAASQAPKKVGFHTDWIGGDRAEMIKQALEQWAKEHPTVMIDQINYASGTGTSYIDQLVAAMSAGTEGDLALWEPAAVQLWAERNAFADIKPVLGKLRYNLEDHMYVPDTITHKGKQVGMPFQTSFRLGWTYNRTLFQRHQVPEPKDSWSWDELIDAAKRLTFPEQNQWGIKQSDQLYWHIPYMLGGKLITDDFQKSLFDSPEVLAALEHHYGLIHRHRVMPSIREASDKKLNWRNYAIGEDCPTPKGMLKMGVDFEAEFDYAPLPLPTGAKRHVVTMGDQPHVVLAAAQRHNVLEEATRLALFLAGDFAGELFMKLLPTFWPTKKKLIESPLFLVNPPQHSRRLLASLKYDRIHGYPLFPYTYPEWMGGWRPVGNRMLNGEISPREAAQQMNIDGDAALARARTAK